MVDACPTLGQWDQSKRMAVVTGRLQMPLLISSVLLLFRHFLRVYLFSGKTEKMAAGCDDFWVIFGIFSQVCYPSFHNNAK